MARPCPPRPAPAQAQSAGRRSIDPGPACGEGWRPTAGEVTFRYSIGIALLAAAVTLGACKPAAPPAKDYAYPAWGFKAAYPATPTEANQPGSADGTTPNAFLAESKAGGRDFVVWTADVSRTNMTLDDLAKSSSEHFAQGLGATAGIPTYSATSEGVMGREYAFTTNGKWRGVMRIFANRGYVYQVAAASEFGKDDPAVNAFLGSFHTLPGAPTRSAPATNAPG